MNILLIILLIIVCFYCLHLRYLLDNYFFSKSAVEDIIYHYSRYVLGLSDDDCRHYVAVFYHQYPIWIMKEILKEYDTGHQ